MRKCQRLNEKYWNVIDLQKIPHISSVFPLWAQKQNKIAPSKQLFFQVKEMYAHFNGNGDTITDSNGADVESFDCSA